MVKKQKRPNGTLELAAAIDRLADAINRVCEFGGKIRVEGVPSSISVRQDQGGGAAGSSHGF